MVNDLIPDEVKRFLLTHIDSVAQLEALLLLRSNPKTAWGEEAMARRLYISLQQTAEVLAHLGTQGFLVCEKTTSLTYRYQPNSPELALMVDRVAELYTKYLVPMTNIIHSKPQTRIQQFADAFRLRERRKK